MDHLEEELKLVEDELLLHAELGLFGNATPVSLTLLFYGYTSNPPPTHNSRH